MRCYGHFVVSYEAYNHTTIRPFKGDELMCNKYCDAIHYGNKSTGHRRLEVFWHHFVKYEMFLENRQRIGWSRRGIRSVLLTISAHFLIHFISTSTRHWLRLLEEFFGLAFALFAFLFLVLEKEKVKWFGKRKGN